jgi:hypothetical protein
MVNDTGPLNEVRFSFFVIGIAGLFKPRFCINKCGIRFGMSKKEEYYFHLQRQFPGIRFAALLESNQTVGVACLLGRQFNY